MPHEFGFLGGVIVSVDYAVEKRVQELLKAAIDLVDTNFLFGEHPRCGLGGLLLFFFKQFKHSVRPVRPQLKWPNKRRNFGVQGLFPHVRLGTLLHLVFLAAAVICVPFLHLSTDPIAAFGAAQEPGKRFWDPFLFPGRPAPAVVNHGLNLVKKVFRNDGLVLSFMHFAGVSKVPVIKRVAEHSGKLGTGEEAAIPRINAVFGKILSNVIKRHIAGCIHFERLAHNGSAFAIHDYRFGAVIVQVSDRRDGRVFTSADLLAEPAFCVFGQGIDVILALPKHDVEHEFPLRVRLEAECGKFQRL